MYNKTMTPPTTKNLYSFFFSPPLFFFSCVKSTNSPLLSVHNGATIVSQV